MTGLWPLRATGAASSAPTAVHRVALGRSDGAAEQAGDEEAVEQSDGEREQHGIDRAGIAGGFQHQRAEDADDDADGRGDGDGDKELLAGHDRPPGRRNAIGPGERGGDAASFACSSCAAGGGAAVAGLTSRLSIRRHRGRREHWRRSAETRRGGEPDSAPPNATSDACYLSVLSCSMIGCASSVSVLATSSNACWAGTLLMRICSSP